MRVRTEPEDERRLYYGLTLEGRERLQAEAEMMSRWAAAAIQERGV